MYSCVDPVEIILTASGAARGARDEDAQEERRETCDASHAGLRRSGSLGRERQRAAPGRNRL